MQLTYAFHIIGENNLARVEAVPEANDVDLSRTETGLVYEDFPLDPGFPMDFSPDYLRKRIFAQPKTDATSSSHDWHA
ncbi:hypothetical protein F5883DRAFT_554328 [Diaporthe sp. PMI_573]|nr:hypothetical protein F5883DRAFT_554328 [Diaporthaceae sp. PMI_573]